MRAHLITKDAELRARVLLPDVPPPTVVRQGDTTFVACRTDLIDGVDVRIFVEPAVGVFNIPTDLPEAPEDGEDQASDTPVYHDLQDVPEPASDQQPAPEQTDEGSLTENQNPP